MTTDEFVNQAGDFTADQLEGPSEVDTHLDAVARQILELHRSRHLEYHLALGRVIVDQLFNGDLDAWRSRGAKDRSFRLLASRRDLAHVSKTTLHRAACVYALSCRLGVPTWKHLGVSHLREVLGLPEQIQEVLLNTAEQERWTVTKIRRLARAHRLPGRGRKPLPRYVKTIRRLASLLDEREGSLEDLATGIARLDPREGPVLLGTLRDVQRFCGELEAALKDRLPQAQSGVATVAQRPAPPLR